MAIKINTTNGNFTPLCFLVLFRRLQSKIAQIQTVKIFWPSNIPSNRVASFYTSCSVHEKCSNLTGIPWKPGTGASFFTVHLTGVTRNLQAVRYIRYSVFFSCDKQLFIKVNVKPTFYCSLLQVMSVFCFRSHTFVVYLRTTKVHNNSVFKELTLHFLLQKSHLWNSPMPSDFQS